MSVIQGNDNINPVICKGKTCWNELMHQHCTYLSSLWGCNLTVSADPQPGDLLYPKVAIN